MRIESSPRGLLTVFFRQFWTFFITFMLVFGSVGAYVLRTVPVYESAGSILIKFGNDARPDVSKNDQNQGDLTPTDRRELIESYTRILQSHDLLVSLVNEIGVEKLYPGISERAPSRETAVEMAFNRLMKGDLTIKGGVQSNLIEIHLLSENPTLAPQFLKRLLEQFIARQADVFNKPQTEFIAQQVQHASAELEKAQASLQQFKDKNGLSSVEEEMIRLLQEKSDAKTVALRSIDEAQNKVDELQARENQLLLSYQADSPAVRKVHESLVVARSQLYSKQADLKAGTTGGSKAASTLSPHIKDIDRRMKELESQRREYNDLYRQVQIAEENYKNYVGKLEEARIKETLNRQNITRISVLDEPTIPLTPVKPNKTLILALGLMGGLLLGLGLVIALETMDERFSRPEQITTVLGVPVIASFTRMRRKG